MSDHLKVTNRKRSRSITLKRAVKKPVIEPVEKKSNTPGKEVSEPPAPPRIKSKKRLSVVINRQIKPLVGREEEFGEICRPLEASLQSRLGCCLYVSGVPGTGKTATVRLVLRALVQEIEFDWIEVNGMRLAAPMDLYPLLWSRLGNPHVSPQAAIKKLDKYFSPESRPCVIVVDEVDTLLQKSKSMSLYRLLEWTGKAPVCVIAIANTMDLPERHLLSGREKSRLGMHRIAFTPYSYPQLIRIISGNGVEGDAAEYCARRVGAVSGDARRALAMAQRARAQFPCVPIGLKEMEIVFSQNFNTLLPLLRACCFEQKLILTAMVLPSDSIRTVEMLLECAVQLSRSLNCYFDWQLLYCNITSLQSSGLLRTNGTLESSVTLGAVQIEDIKTAYKAEPLLSRFCMG